MAGTETEPLDRRSGDRAAVVPEPGWGGRELRHYLCPADLRGVAEARALLRGRLAEWGVPELGDTAELLASELVTNALVHTPGGALLTAGLTTGPQGRLRVEVCDLAEQQPQTRPVDDRAAGGRGLLIVRALADDWGVTRRRVGKTVWFELANPAP